MALLNILTYPHPHLRIVAKPVEHFDVSVHQLCKDMLETMYREEGCGLAATQVGRSERIFVLDVSRTESEPLCFINPEIIARIGEEIFSEGCLSFPGVYAKVQRAKQLTVRYQNPTGEPQTLEATGLLAICIQHELDHLNGIVFVDQLSLFKRNWALRKLKLDKITHE